MNYFKMRHSCKEKTLSWNKEDFHALAASMSLEELRLMERQMEDYAYPCHENATPEAIVYDYILLLAYEAVVAQDDAEAALIYELINASESSQNKAKRAII